MPYAHFHQVARFLKKQIKLEHPVYIRRMKTPKGIEGDCDFKKLSKSKGVFIIRINKSLAVWHAIEVLLHEYGHAVAWDRDKDDHGPNWGRAYSLVYRKFLNFLETSNS